MKCVTTIACTAFLLLLLDSMEVSAICKGDLYTIQHRNGSEECFPCPSCPVGYGLEPPCGSILGDAPSLQCKPCKLGETYSPDEGVYPCLPCGICSQHEKVTKNCTLESNSKCGRHCDKGFYYEEDTGDCQPCSFCCFDGDDVVIEKCKKEGMPAYKQCSVEQNYRCSPKCRSDQYMLVNNFKKPVCLDCPTCKTGTGLCKKCGSIIKNRNMVKCLPCNNGTTFSDSAAAAQCKKCSTCLSKAVTKACSPSADTQCGDCLRGFYKENSTDRCAQCSYCCEDDSDVRVDQCVQQGMPVDRQCLYIKRSITTCHRKIAKSSDKNRYVAVIAPLVLLVVVLILVMIYIGLKYKLRKSRLKGYWKMSEPLDEERGCSTDKASVASQSTDVEWAVISGATKPIKFTKSGVEVKFANLESYKELSRNLAVEICWGEVNYPLLEEGEVFLSPVVRFHPYNKILRETVCVKIPHSAKLAELKLKCGVLQENRFIWQDVPESQFTTEATDICFHTNKLQAYIVVASGGTIRKRMQCALFAGKELKHDRFTADLCFIDDCEASEERIIQEEHGKGKTCHGGCLRALDVSITDDENVNIELQTISEGWSLINIEPKALKGKLFVHSYKNIPRCEITFARNDKTKEDFQCTVVASNKQGRAVLSVFSYFEEELQEKKIVEELSSDKISDLPPEILLKIKELMSEKEVYVVQETPKIGIQETGREHRGTYLNMTVQEFTTRLKKDGRPDVVEVLTPYLYQATEV